MKKYIALLLALVMLLLTACGTAQPPVDGTTPTTEVTAPSGTEATQGNPTEPSSEAPTDEPTTEPTEGKNSGTGDTEETTPSENPTEETQPPETEPTKPVDVKVSINKTSLSLEVGQTSTLSASYNGTKSLTWSSSNTSVATVSNGKVTAKAAGTATIKVTDGSVTATCNVTVTAKPVETEPTQPPVEVSVKLNKTSATLNIGDTLSLTATTTGSGSLSWSSDNTSVATVSNGKVTAKGAGTATITATYGGKTATCKITVNKPVEVKLSLNKTSITLNVGETSTITANYSGASGKPAWSSSNTSVATVDSNGKVTAKGAGTAVITASYGGKNAQCAVTVNKPVEVRISLNKTSITLEVGETSTLTASYNGTKSLTWSSDNTAVATVSNGKVTAKGAGTATIKVTDGSVTATCKVTVTAVPEETKPSVGELTIKTPKGTVVYVGETLQIEYTYTGDKSALTFKASNASVLTVNNSGLVTAVQAGRTNVNVYHGDTLLGSVGLVVQEKPAETGPALKAESISTSNFTGPYFNGVSGVVGNYMTFTALAKTSGDNQAVTATSSNSGVATVSRVSVGSSNVCTFKVSFVGTGSTTITITSEDGCASTSYTLNVKGGYSSAMGGQLTPEQFVACVNGIMAENGATINTSVGYRVLTLTDAELTGSKARAYAESWVREFWPNGIRSMGLAYQGVNEDGNHVFYIHR